MSVAEERDKLRKLRDAGSITGEQYERAVAELEADRRPPDRDDGYGDRRPRRRSDDLTPRRRERQTREWATLLHLSLLAGHAVPFGGIVAPIVLWQMKKDELPGIDRHGKNAINWMISSVIYLAASAALCLVFVGFVLLPVVAVLCVVFPIVAAVRANEGRVWKYPLAIPFLT